MDMSFFSRTGERLAGPCLDYPTLVAMLAATPRQAVRDPLPTVRAPMRRHDLSLATVVLGRPGWADAARALGGCFVPCAAE